jgi:hypothetical protein
MTAPSTEALSAVLPYAYLMAYMVTTTWATQLKTTDIKIKDMVEVGACLLVTGILQLYITS